MIPTLSAVALLAAAPLAADAPMRARSDLRLIPALGELFPAATPGKTGSCVPAALLGGFIGYLVGGTVGAGLSMKDHEIDNPTLLITVTVVGIIAGGFVGYQVCRS